MNLEFNLHKMESEVAEPVKYYLRVSEFKLAVNDLIGKDITWSFRNQINCVRCGAITKTSFAQGYCYACFVSAPETEDCVLRPELCQAHIGISRDMNYAESHCLIDHYVYMAISGGLKVGVTRYTQNPVRWIDQGASKAIIVAKTPNRYIAGNIEVALKSHFQDKTNWRKMLSPESFEFFKLADEKHRALELLHQDFKNYAFEDDSLIEIQYPISKYPVKIKSVSFDRQAIVSGNLAGIKGQYLIFSSGEVINIRKHGGYRVELSY